MSIARHLKQASLALLMLSSATALQSAYAEGTTAGTSISNTASVNYSVGGVAQTPINSTTASFVVDRRIFLSVVAISYYLIGILSKEISRFLLANASSASPAHILLSGDFEADGAATMLESATRIPVKTFDLAQAISSPLPAR